VEEVARIIHVGPEGKLDPDGNPMAQGWWVVIPTDGDTFFLGGPFEDEDDAVRGLMAFIFGEPNEAAHTLH